MLCVYHLQTTAVNNMLYVSQTKKNKKSFVLFLLWILHFICIAPVKLQYFHFPMVIFLFFTHVNFTLIIVWVQDEVM